MELQFKHVHELPTPDAMKALYPINQETRVIKERRDQEIADIIAGKDDRLMLIIGPCSADREDAVLDYIYRLAKIQDKVSDKIYIVPRIYTNKPRTTGDGYKGMASQPDPEKKPNMLEGLLSIRKLHMRAVEETGFTCADEMLYPENHAYLSDLLSYVAVGARSVENQQHRLVASGIGIACGMKNPTSGSISVMLNSITAAQHPHTFVYRGWEVDTPGNPYAHAILRGFANHHGESTPNYHIEDLELTYRLYHEKGGLQNCAAIIDTNHANSNKDPFAQPRICREVLYSMRYNDELRDFIKGFMIESYLEDGAQPIGSGCYGKSITDPCLGWDKTEKLILDLADWMP